jgi:hypothetical protein
VRALQILVHKMKAKCWGDDSRACMPLFLRIDPSMSSAATTTVAILRFASKRGFRVTSDGEPRPVVELSLRDPSCPR